MKKTTIAALVLAFISLGTLTAIAQDPAPAAKAPDPNPLAAENVMLKNKLAVTETMLQEAQWARRDWEISARQVDAVATGLKDQASSAKHTWMQAQAGLAATNKALTDELEKAKAQCAVSPPKQ